MAQRSYDPEVMAARLAGMAAAPVDDAVKGLPPGLECRFADVAGLGLNLLAGDLPMPVAVLRESALDANRAWMARFLHQSGVRIAPHGKTPMAPAIVQMQMEDGAWGITAATAQQVAFFAGLGVKRIILANQLVTRRNIQIVLDCLRADAELEVFCLIDSAEGAALLAQAVQAHGLARPMQVLIEVGAAGARTGVRGFAAALALAQDVAALAPHLSLRGVEAYEGVFGDHDFAARTALARQMTQTVVDLARACAEAGLLGPGPVLVTAGGTEFFDLAAAAMATGVGGRDFVPVIRSGCYVTHDHLSFERMFQRLLARAPDLGSIAPRLTPALEVWAAVQSQPEPGLAFATMGKRDVSYDVEMPAPVLWFRPGRDTRPQPMPPGYRVMRLNDQHAFLETPVPSGLAVGDLIGFGVSHVCTTFDKWRSVLLVDDDYRVTGAMRTFF